MSEESLYSRLNIPDHSEISLVKKAFRQLALKYHPDRNPDPEAAEIFKTLARAYEVLSNPGLKQNYDFRLKNGFATEQFRTDPVESEWEKRRKWYAKMRRDMDELREVENITAYEKSIKTIPFIWRLILIGMVMITGIFSILSDWYQKGNKIAFGILLFVFSSLILWNEVYKYFWYRSRTVDEKKYDRQAYSTFITVFLIGVFLTFGLIKIKKAWQLHYFGKVIYATLDFNKGAIYYSYNNQLYQKEFYNIPEELEYRSQILINISTKEPEIWEYVETDTP